MMACRASEFRAPAGGLSFAAQGRRLAIAYHGGVAIATRGGKGWTQKHLEWPGSHIGVTWSPDGRFLMSAMQNNALHGWRIADSANIHINGFDGKPRSLSWSKRGRFLASSGGNGALLWSFRGKDGPIGQRPMQAGARECAVTAVAFHPSADLVAIGYGDGAITIVRWADEMMMVVRPPDGRPIEQLLWAPDSSWLAFGADEGITGVVKSDWIAWVAHGGI
jgi:WD40 repeat protein